MGQRVVMGQSVVMGQKVVMGRVDVWRNSTCKGQRLGLWYTLGGEEGARRGARRGAGSRMRVRNKWMVALRLLERIDTGSQDAHDTDALTIRTTHTIRTIPAAVQEDRHGIPGYSRRNAG